MHKIHICQFSTKKLSDGGLQGSELGYSVLLHSYAFNFVSISKVLICRNYMGNIDINEIDNFMPIMMKREEDEDLSPVIIHGSTHFLWIKHSNLYCILYMLVNLQI